MSSSSFHQLLSPTTSKKKEKIVHVGYTIAVFSNGKALLNAINEVLVTERQDKANVFAAIPSDEYEYKNINKTTEGCQLIVIDITAVEGVTFNFYSTISLFMQNLEITKEVLFVGSQDSVSLLNFIEQKGASYCLGYPNDENAAQYKRFLLQNDELLNLDSRTSKEIHVLGAVGDSGNTIISCIISAILAESTSTLLVSHNPLGSDLDLYMGADILKAEEIDKDTLSMMDIDIASSLVDKIQKNLCVLNVGFPNLVDHFEKMNNVTKPLKKGFNFIVHDVSAFSLRDHLTHHNTMNISHLVVVVQPTLKGLKVYQKIIETLSDDLHQDRYKISVIINQAYPSTEYFFLLSDFKKKLEQSISSSMSGTFQYFTIGYDKSMRNKIIDADLLNNKKSEMYFSLQTLISVITGRQFIKPKKSLFSGLTFKRKKKNYVNAKKKEPSVEKIKDVTHERIHQKTL